MRTTDRRLSCGVLQCRVVFFFFLPLFTPYLWTNCRRPVQYSIAVHAAVSTVLRPHARRLHFVLHPNVYTRHMFSILSYLRLFVHVVHLSLGLAIFSLLIIIICPYRRYLIVSRFFRQRDHEIPDIPRACTHPWSLRTHGVWRRHVRRARSYLLCFTT